MIPIRLTETQVAQLDALAKRLPGASSRSALVRDLLQRALEEAHDDPAVLIRPSPTRDA